MKSTTEYIALLQDDMWTNADKYGITPSPPLPMIRQLKQEEYNKAAQLSLSVYIACGKADFDEEGLDTFKNFIYDESCINALTIYGAFKEEEELIGILGLKNGGRHISLFFIKPQYHRKGIGKALFHYATSKCPSVEVTVNSSTYAIPFYQSLGFAVIGEKQTYQGISSTPMRRYHAIIVQKKNYILRTWEAKDAPSLAKYLDNKKIWDNCRDALPYPYKLEDAKGFIEMIKQKEGIHDFCIEVNGEAIGNIGFVPETDIQRFNAEVGYVIGEPYWNQGIVTDALKEAIHYYFSHSDKVRIFAYVFAYNIPSIRVLEKAGFTKVGIMRQSIYKNERFIDAHCYELVK